MAYLLTIMTKLANIRREKFCRLYATHTNGSRAARGAGYAPSSAGVEACRMLKDPVILARIQQILAKDGQLLAISRAEAMHEVSALATFNPQDMYDDDGNLIPIQDLPREVAMSIKEIKGQVVPAEYDVDGNIVTPARMVAGDIKAGSDKKGALDMALRVHNAYKDDNEGSTGEIHIHLDEKDMQA